MMSQKSTFNKIGIASLIMMASIFSSRLIGVFREMTIAGVGGIQAGVDAYQIAFVLPEILNHIVASGFLSVTFIPIFTRYMSQGRSQEGYRIFSIIHNCFGLLLVCCITASMIWAPQLVNLVAPGIDNPETLALAVKMTRIILPAQFFFFSGGLLMALQFANEKFFIPALAPLIYNIFIILGGLVLGKFMGMEGFAWGVLSGAFLGNFALQIFGARKIGATWSLDLSFFHPDLIQYFKLTLPLMLGLTMAFSTEFQLKFFGSFLPQGSIAAMNYALRVMFVVVGLFGQAVGVASYPFMAKLAGEDKIDDLNFLLNRTLKFLFLVIPVSVLFAVLSHEIVLILFQRWEFDAEATRLTQGILPYFMMGAFAFSAQTIVARGYYAMQNTLFPSVSTSMCVLLSLPQTYLLMTFYGVRGVAMGLSLSVILQTTVLFECWSRKHANPGRKDVYRFLIKITGLSLMIWAILYFSAHIMRDIFDVYTFTGAAVTAILTGIEFILIFYACGRIFKITEILSLFETIIKKVVPWMKKSA